MTTATQPRVSEWPSSCRKTTPRSKKCARQCARDKVCLRDGDLKTEWQGFAGNLFISANSKTKPMVVDADKRTALRPQDGRPYAGCYAHASIEIWCQDNKNGKRINASLLAVMFAKHAEPFAGGSLPTDDEFESVPEAEVEQENEFL
jgi:hypothetical protein